MALQRPVQGMRLGRIKVVIWANQSPNGPWYSVQVCRAYKDDHGEWKQSDSFGRDDIPLVCKALDQAHTWIFEQARPPKNGPQGVDSAVEEASDPVDARIAGSA